MSDLSNLTVCELLERLDSQRVSATECVQFFIDRAKQRSGLNAFITADFDEPMKAAEQIDQRRQRGEKIGKLGGLPIAVKDGICTTGIRTTAGSKILGQFKPPYNATVIQRLIDADAIVLGKTNMDEFAMGSSTENPHFGNCQNPWDQDRVAGGSSGGSAVAVAADMSPASLGSDTGGSIRQPASFCGITGLKPTYGRVSRYGLVAFASSLDQIGPLSRSAADVAILLNVIAGYDPKDSTSSRESVPDYAISIDKPVTGLRIGVCREHLEEGIDDQVRQSILDSINALKQMGATIVDVVLPHSKFSVAAYYVIASCEASSNLARYDGVRYTARAKADDLQEMYQQTRADGFGPEVQRRVMLGTFALSSGYYDEYYINASKVRRLIVDDYLRALDNVDMMLGPTTPTTAFKIGEKINDPVSMYMADVFTVSANLVGSPAISIPAGFSSSGLPIGLQLQGKPFDEASLLRVAHQFQSQTDHHHRRPANNTSAS